MISKTSVTFILTFFLLSASSGKDTMIEESKKRIITLQTADVVESDRQALLALYESTDGPNWDITWDLSASPREWHGIEVSDDGRVTSINLQDNRLNGTLPEELFTLTELQVLFLRDNRIRGSLSSAIGDLSQLITLNLRINDFESELPATLGNLTQLQTLDLSLNSFSGAIPVEIGTLTAAITIDFEGNDLSGTIPDEIGSLSNLTHLDLTNNDLTGAIPIAIGNLAALEVLDLSDNFLEGNLPAEIGNLTTLEELYLVNNRLSGTLPDELMQLANLTHLFLQDNQLSGAIPASINGLTSLQWLDLQRNDFSGSIPDEIGDVSSLTNALLAQNQFSGDITTNVANLSNLVYLDLSNNSFSGELPDLSAITNLSTLLLANNHLSGLPDLSALTLNSFTVNNNQLDFEDIIPNVSVLSNYTPQRNAVSESVNGVAGDITLTITTGTATNNAFQWHKDGSAIEGANSDTYTFTYADDSDAGNYYVEVTNSSATSLTITKAFVVVPDGLSTHPDFNALQEIYTALNGPRWTNNANWLVNSDLSTWSGVTMNGDDRVSEINLNSRQLEGELPVAIGDLTELTVLDLSFNAATTTSTGLRGNLPEEIGNLSNLTELNLGNTAMGGELPAALWTLGSLQELDLGYNAFEGSIPAEVGDLTSLTSLILRSNNISGEVPAEIGDLVALTTLELWGNELSGSLPAEIGNLSNLTNFQIGINSLSGSIPEELFQLTNLQILIMRDNDLSGSIPASIGNLTNVWYMDLGLNKLEGSIPAEIGNMSSINWLLLNQNRLSGALPTEIGNLSTLTNLWLYINNLTGELPEELGNLTAITELRIDQNQLSGNIPESLGNLASLTFLTLNNNRLTGDIPDIFGSLNAMQRMFFGQNELTGEIPASLWTLSNLTELRLEGNQLSGEIPAETADLAALNWFVVSDNELSGELPSEVADLENLNYFFVSDNRLTGAIPEFNANQPLIAMGLNDNLFDALPDFSIHNGVPSIIVSNNNLDFGDLVPQYGLLTLYSPQNKVDEVISTFVNAGESYTMEVSDLTVGNAYQWYLDGNAISAATSSSFTIDAFDSDDAGIYTCIITNSEIPVFLELERNAVTLSINTTPSALQLDSNTIEENNAERDQVGLLAVTDAEDSDFSFALTGTDADKFAIEGFELLALESFNFEEQSSFNITIEATDQGGLTVSEDFVVEILDINDGPSGISIDSDLINENEATGTVVGSFSTTDEDDSDFTYVLSGTDAELFTISGDQLLTQSVFNFEENATYMISVTASDDGGLSITGDFIVTVVNVNEAPNGLALSATTVAENSNVETLIGELSAEDVDADEVLTYSLSGDNAALFLISGNQLLTASSLDHEIQSSYEISITCTDSQGLSVAETFTIQVENVNEAPGSIALSNAQVAEGLDIGAVVGTIDVVDVDDNSWTLGISGDDASAFSVSGSELVTSEIFDREAKENYTLTITATDTGGLSVASNFEISIADVNEAPFSITLDSNEVEEGLPEGSLIGQLTAEDPENNDLTLSLGGENATSFKIEEANLLTNEVFSSETPDELSIRITATDDGGLSFTQDFIITVLRVATPLHSENLSEQDLIIFPNPASHRFKVVTTFSGELTWALSDLSGKIFNVQGIISKSDGRTTIDVDVEALPSGVYLLKLDHKDGFSIRIVKIVK